MRTVYSGSLQYSLGRDTAGRACWVLLLASSGDVLARGTARSMRQAGMDLASAITAYLLKVVR